MQLLPIPYYAAKWAWMMTVDYVKLCGAVRRRAASAASLPAPSARWNIPFSSLLIEVGSTLRRGSKRLCSANNGPLHWKKMLLGNPEQESQVFSFILCCLLSRLDSASTRQITSLSLTSLSCLHPPVAETKSCPEHTPWCSKPVAWQMLPEVVPARQELVANNKSDR